jgi:hypothetical protein
VLLALTISLLLLGILLLVLSIRGRRVGETRYCRECAFDLTGITTATSRAPSRCPAELGRLDAIWGEEIIIESVAIDWSAVERSE